ncbi:MAG: aminoacyl-tRNA hydrolase [Bacillota bacterium]|nr:aminoacyl-tRNA hydrolase [Bacillota bacterium]
MASEATGRWAVVGLGNPGPEYATTRHNLGFRALDRLAQRHALRWRRRERYLWAELPAAGTAEGAILVKPLTYMNLSGEAVRAVLARWRVPLARLLVVHDDMDLPCGRLRLRRGGRAAGHHGVESLIESLGSPDFARLRIGIGHPPAGEDVVAYVLGAPAPEEEAVLEQAVEKASDVVRLVLERGLEAAMNQANRSGGGEAGGGGGMLRG